MDKLKWQTGKPIRDEWYWIKREGTVLNRPYKYTKDSNSWRHGSEMFSNVRLEWAGPLPEPEN